MPGNGNATAVWRGEPLMLPPREQRADSCGLSPLRRLAALCRPSASPLPLPRCDRALDDYEQRSPRAVGAQPRLASRMRGRPRGLPRCVRVAIRDVVIDPAASLDLVGSEGAGGGRGLFVSAVERDVGEGAGVLG